MGSEMCIRDRVKAGKTGIYIIREDKQPCFVSLVIAEIFEAATIHINKVLRFANYCLRYVHKKIVFTKVRFLFERTTII